MTQGPSGQPRLRLRVSCMLGETQQLMNDLGWLQLAKLELVHPTVTDEPPADIGKSMPSWRGPQERGRDLDPPMGEYYLG